MKRLGQSALRLLIPPFALCLSAQTTIAAPASTASVAPLNISADAIDYTLSAQALTNSCDAIIENARKRIERVLLQPRARVTFASTVVRLEDISADVNDLLVAHEFLGSVSSDRGVRDASDRCQDASSQLFSNLNNRPELSREIGIVEASKPKLDQADAKLLEMWQDGVLHSGANLPTAQREEVRRLFQRIDELETAFSANLANSAPTITLQPSQTGGLPKDLLAGWTHNADGSVVIPVNESTENRFMSFAADPGAREAYLRAYTNRGYPDNLDLLRETLAVRLRLARLLGRTTWAEYVLADHMAKTPDRVQHFLDDLDAKLLPIARRNIDTLAQIKAADLHQVRAEINPWDVLYYHERNIEAHYSVNSDEIRRYFPVEHTINAVLNIYAKVLSVRFAPVQPAHVWSPDVREYTVSNAADGKFLGTLYLDLYPRPGKYTHFASFPLLAARRTPDGALRPPIDAIVGNWAEPAPGQPALLSHDEVETFFHEFGHAMAAILTTAPYESLSSGFRTDFVEAPSQMLENWVWDPGILRELSSNVDTGAPMPDALIQKLIASRFVDEAYFTTRQILFADVDMAYHSADPGDDTTERWRQIAERVTPVALIAGTHPEASFGHIMGGYDAGYYGYLWSKVYAQDMFTAFSSVGLESPIVGARYRHDILEPARTIEPDDEVQAFLGRPVNPAAFYHDLGLTPDGR